MVVNEKALMRCLKEAYKNQGYTVAVYDGWAVINAGYWLVRIAEEETSNELRSLITLHMRDFPDEGEAFKTVKGDCGPIVQRVILEDALKSLGTMEARLVETMGENGPTIIRQTALRMGTYAIWQKTPFISGSSGEALLRATQKNGFLSCRCTVPLYRFGD